MQGSLRDQVVFAAFDTLVDAAEAARTSDASESHAKAARALSAWMEENHVTR